MASGVYTTGSRALGTQSISWTSDTIKLLLVRSTYTPSAAHVYVSDVNTYEVSGGGYARKTLAGKTKTDNTGSSRVEYDASDVALGTLTAAAGSYRYAIVYKDTGSDATSSLLAWVDLGSQTPAGVAYTIVWASTGVFHRSLFLDDVTRADSTTSAGPLWTNQAGTGGVSSNQIYPVALASGRLKVTAAPSFTAELAQVKIPAYSGTAVFGLFVRSSGDTGLLVGFGISTTRLEVYDQSAAGTFTLVSSSGSVTYAANDLLTVLVEGNDFRVYVNGTLRHTFTSSLYSSQTGIGLYADHTSARFDDVRAEGAWTVGTVSITSSGTGTWSNASPTDGGTGIELLDAASIRFTPNDGAGNPASPGTAAVTIDGVAGTVTTTAVGSYSYDLATTFPFLLGKAHTVTWSIQTSDTTTNTYPHTFTVRDDYGDGLALVDWTVAAATPHEAVVEFGVAGATPHAAVVDWGVVENGLRTAHDALLELSVLAAPDFLTTHEALLQFVCTIYGEYEWALSADIGEPGQYTHPLTTDVSGEWSETLPWSLAVSSDNNSDPGPALSLDIAETGDATWALSADIGEAGQYTHPLSVDIWGVYAWLLVLARLRSEQLANEEG